MRGPCSYSREPTAQGLLLSGSLLTYVDELFETPKTVPDRTVGQWHNLREARHLFPAEVQRWTLFHVFDREARTRLDSRQGVVREPNPTTHGGFNDKDVPFWSETGFWRPPEVQFRRADDGVRCETFLVDRLNQAAAARRRATR